MLLVSCSETPNNKVFRNFHKKIDSISFNNEKIVIEKHYTKENIEYNIIFKKQSYKIPYVFIVGKDTIQANDLYIRKLDSGSNAFIISFLQGSATEFQYYYNFSEEKEIAFNKITLLYSDMNGNVVNVDSITIEKKLNTLNQEDVKRIISFINEHQQY